MIVNRRREMGGIADKYIHFADPNVLQVLLNAGIGDGVGITSGDAATANLGTLFKNNTNIVSFDEFSYFTSQHARDTSFEGCTNLERVDISNCSKLPVFVGDNNLEYYNGASSVQGTCIIPDGVTEIKASGFQNNYKLTAVHIPSSITKMNNGSFTNDSSLQAVHITDLDAWCRINFTFTNSNPLYVGAHKLYINGVQATSIDIPSTITTLLQYVFRNFETMQQVTIPSSITAINSNAFEGCTGLQRVDITDLDAWCGITFGNESANPLSYAKHLYLNNTLVTTVDLTNITALNQYVFENLESLTSVTNFNGLTMIGVSAFKGCTNLVIQDLNLPNLTTLGSYAFSGTKVQTISDLGSVTSIPEYCFKDCSQLTTIEQGVLDNITVLNKEAFNNCTNLGSAKQSDNTISSVLRLPNLTSIALDSVRYTKFTEIADLGSITTVTGFSEMTNLTSVALPQTCTTIGDSAFKNDKALTTINLNNITSIGASAFIGCNNLIYFYGAGSVAGELDLSNVTSIGRGAFRNCSSLTSVTINAVTPPTLESNAFDGTNNCPIYVPAGSVSTYQTAANWSTYASRIQAIPT